MPAKKVTKAAPKAAVVGRKAPKMKPYTEMTKDEMSNLVNAGRLDQDVLEDFFPE